MTVNGDRLKEYSIHTEFTLKDILKYIKSIAFFNMEDEIRLYKNNALLDIMPSVWSPGDQQWLPYSLKYKVNSFRRCSRYRVVANFNSAEDVIDYYTNDRMDAHKKESFYKKKYPKYLVYIETFNAIDISSS